MLRFRQSFSFAALLLLTLALLPIATVSAASAAQPAGLTMQVVGGYDGNYKLGEWFPVQVLLANDGAGFSGRLQIEAYGQDGEPISNYARDVDLPSPSRKQITLYTYAASFQRDFLLRLLQGSRVVAEQNVRLTPLEEPAFILGVIDDDPALLNVLAGESMGQVGQTPQPPWSSSSASTGDASTTVAHMTLDQVAPSAQALAGLDALVIGTADTSKMTPEQLAAINGWVVQGGALVVSGGADAATNASGLADLLPVRVTGNTQLDSFPSLATFAGFGSAPTGRAPIAVSEPIAATGATVLAAAGNVPLLVSRKLGQGQVLFMALDPNLPPLKGWDGTVLLWNSAFADQSVHLSSGAFRRMQQSYSYYSYGETGSPFDIPSFELPSALLVALFLLLYIVAIGPLNYLVLRRLKRTELAWVTIPALIILFAVGAYLFGRQSRGSELLIAHSNVIKTYPGASRAAVESYIGFFSPDRRSYDIDLGGDLEVTEVSSSGYGASSSEVPSPATIYQGDPSRLSDLTLDIGRLRGFMAEGTIAYNSPYEANLQLVDGRLKGTLTNRSGSALQDVAVYSGGSFQKFNTLGAGEQKNIDLRLSQGATLRLAETLIPNLPVNTYSTNYTAEERIALRKASLLNTAVFDQESASVGDEVMVGVLGWSSETPFKLQVAGVQPRRDELNLIVSTVPVQIGTGQVDIPPGLIRRQVLAGNVNQTGTPGQMQVNLSTAVFGYYLPAGVNVQELTFHYEYDASQGLSRSVPVFVWNWQSGDWDELKENWQPLIRANKSSGSIAIPDVADHVSPTGEVQIQLGDEEDSYYNYIYIEALDLSAKGTK